MCHSAHQITVISLELWRFINYITYLLTYFLPARRYASAGLCDSDVSVRPSVRLSHAGIVPIRAKAGS